MSPKSGNVWQSQPLQQHQQEGTPATTPPPAPNPPAPEGGRTFTQAEVDQLVGREKLAAASTAKSATATEIAQQLGCTVEEAKGYIAAARAADDKDKSDAQLAKEAADKEKADAVNATSVAKREAHDAKVERALVRAGIPLAADDATPEDQAKADARIAKIVGLVEAKVGDDDAAIKTAVAALKDTMPELFGSEAGTGTPKTPPSDPKTPPKTPKQAEDAMQRGAERAKTTVPSGYAWESPSQPATT